MSVEYPFDKQQSEWDRLVLGDVVIPGVCVSLVPSLTFDYDLGKNQGTDGAPFIYRGLQPRKVEATIIISKKADFDEFVTNTVKKLPVQNSLKTVQPLAFGHPQGAIWGISEVYITGIVPQTPDPVVGWIISISLVENALTRPARKSTTVKRREQAAKEGLGARRKPTNPLNS
jgi:hypothetical protein